MACYLPGLTVPKLPTTVAGGRSCIRQQCLFDSLFVMLSVLRFSYILTGGYVWCADRSGVAAKAPDGHVRRAPGQRV